MSGKFSWNMGKAENPLSQNSRFWRRIKGIDSGGNFELWEFRPFFTFQLNSPIFRCLIISAKHVTARTGPQMESSYYKERNGGA